MPSRRVRRPLGAALLLVFAVLAPHAADAALPAKKPSIAMLNVQAPASFSASDIAAIEGVLTLGLEAGGRFEVTGRSDIVTMMGFEQQKQALGCDNTSCMAELAGALGVDYVAAADIGHLGDVFVLNLRIIDAKAAKAAARASRRVASPSELAAAADAVAHEAINTLLGIAPVAEAPPSAPVPWGVVGGAAVSVVALLAGAYLGSQSAALLEGDVKTKSGALTAHSITERNAADARSYAIGANVMFGVGGLAAVGTGALFFLSPPGSPAGAGGGLRGSF